MSKKLINNADLRLRFPRHLYLRFKEKTLNEGTSMQFTLRCFVELYLKNNKIISNYLKYKSEREEKEYIKAEGKLSEDDAQELLRLIEEEERNSAITIKEIAESTKENKQ